MKRMASHARSMVPYWWKISRLYGTRNFSSPMSQNKQASRTARAMSIAFAIMVWPPLSSRNSCRFSVSSKRSFPWCPHSNCLVLSSNELRKNRYRSPRAKPASPSWRVDGFLPSRSARDLRPNATSPGGWPKWEMASTKRKGRIERQFSPN